MARLYFQVKHLGRLTQKAPVAKHVAYILREADYGPAAAHVRYMAREDGSRSREDLAHKEVHNLPEWAEGNAAQFFGAAEKYERANGRFSTTWELALPRELDHRQQVELARDFLQGQFGTRHVYAFALHDSAASDGGRNPHIHVIFSSRTLDGIDREAGQFFRRYNREHPEQGGAEKAPHWTQQRTLYAVRQAWSDSVNIYLEHAGVEARIDPRRLEERGIDRVPTRTVEPYHPTQAKYHGRTTPQWAAALAERAAIDYQGEQRLAAQAWEQRKQHLGLSPDMDHDQAIARIAAASREPRPQQEPPSLETIRQHEGAIIKQVIRDTDYHARLHIAAEVEAERASHGSFRSPGVVRAMTALLQEDEGVERGAVYRDREREQGHDLGW